MVGPPSSGFSKCLCQCSRAQYTPHKQLRKYKWEGLVRLKVSVHHGKEGIKAFIVECVVESPHISKGDNAGTRFFCNH